LSKPRRVLPSTHKGTHPLDPVISLAVRQEEQHLLGVAPLEQ